MYSENLRLRLTKLSTKVMVLECFKNDLYLCTFDNYLFFFFFFFFFFNMLLIMVYSCLITFDIFLIKTMHSYKVKKLKVLWRR